MWTQYLQHGIQPGETENRVEMDANGDVIGNVPATPAPQRLREELLASVSTPQPQEALQPTPSKASPFELSCATFGLPGVEASNTASSSRQLFDEVKPMDIHAFEKYATQGKGMDDAMIVTSSDHSDSESLVIGNLDDEIASIVRSLPELNQLQ